MVQRLPNRSILLLQHPGSHLENALCCTFTSLKAQILPGESYSGHNEALPGSVQAPVPGGPRCQAASVASEWPTETKHSRPKGPVPLCEFCCVCLYKADHGTDGGSLVQQENMESGTMLLISFLVGTRGQAWLTASPALVSRPHSAWPSDRAPSSMENK